MSNTSYASINSLDEFTIIGGTDFTFKFSVKDEDGIPVDLTGATLLLKIAPYGQASNVITTITGTIGVTDDIAEFILSSASSEGMIGGKYMYQPIIEDSGSKIHRPKQGVFLLVQAIGNFADTMDVPASAYYLSGLGTNSYTATSTITSYYAGLSIIFYVQNTNSANSTLTLSSIAGTKNLMKFDSIGGKVVLVAGDLLVNKKYFFAYDGTDWVLVGLMKSEIDSMIGSTYAPIASPTFTGIPAAPTATAGTNTTQLATTAFVLANDSGGWKIGTGTWAYVSADAPTFVFNIPSDVTGIIQAG